MRAWAGRPGYRLMQRLQATAPGKLVIVGEYSVLRGGPAIATAADRRAVVSLSRPAGSWSEMHIANTGQCSTFALEPGGIDWQQDPGDYGRVLSAAVMVGAQQGLDMAALAPFRLELCTREFHAAAAGVKLGLGSSAALTVALTGCLQQALGGATDLPLALAVHKAFQQGHGSGIDVCTSYCGGVILRRNGGATENLQWPTALSVVPVWTGCAASTPAMLAHLSAYAAEQPTRHAELLALLSTIAGAAVQSWEAGNVPALLSNLEEFAAGLRQLDAATGLGIWSAQHDELAALAAAEGLVYKPSGAGGGDFGLAFCADAAVAERFRSVAAAAGYTGSDLQLGGSGLTISSD